MIARFTGASLGLLAFAVAVAGGVWVGNPVVVTLSRAIGSLVLFCLLGLIVGGAAQAVINDHARKRLESLRMGVEANEAPDRGSTPVAAEPGTAGGMGRAR